MSWNSSQPFGGGTRMWASVGIRSRVPLPRWHPDPVVRRGGMRTRWFGSGVPLTLPPAPAPGRPARLRERRAEVAAGRASRGRDSAEILTVRNAEPGERVVDIAAEKEAMHGEHGEHAVDRVVVVLYEFGCVPRHGRAVAHEVQVEPAALGVDAVGGGAGGVVGWARVYGATAPYMRGVTRSNRAGGDEVAPAHGQRRSRHFEERARRRP